MDKQFSAALFLLATIMPGCDAATGQPITAPAVIRSAAHACEADGDPSGHPVVTHECFRQWGFKGRSKPCEADGNPSGKPVVTHKCERRWGWANRSS